MVMLTMNVTHSDACLVYLIDHSTNEVVLRALSQLPHDAEIGNVRLKMGEGITLGWVAAQQVGLWPCPEMLPPTRGSSRSAHFRKILTRRSCPFRWWIAARLSARHQRASRGAASAFERRSGAGHFHRRAGWAAVIARAKLAEQSRLQISVRRMETLAAVAAGDLGRKLSGKRIPRRRSRRCWRRRSISQPSASILLVDDGEKKELTVSAARCSAPDYMHRMPIRMEGSLIEYVVRQGHPIIIPNIHNEKQYRYPELARKSGLTSLLAAPAAVAGQGDRVNQYLYPRGAGVQRR